MKNEKTENINATKIKIIGYILYFVLLSIIVLFLLAQFGIFDKKKSKNNFAEPQEKEQHIQETTKTEQVKTIYY